METEKKKQEMLDVELSIGKALRVGVVFATAVMALGIILLLFKNGQTGYPADYIPIKPLEILQGVFAGKPFAIMMTGLFLLIMTPVLRVIVSIYAFYVEGDKLYVYITLIVLIILVISMLIGYFTGL